MKRSGRSARTVCSLIPPETGVGCVVVLMTWPAALSMEKRAMYCGLPLSKSWKSSCLRLPTALPYLSRTTTGTITRLTRALKSAGSSFVAISAGALAGAAGGVWGAVWAMAEIHNNAAATYEGLFISAHGSYSHHRITAFQPQSARFVEE